MADQTSLRFYRIVKTDPATIRDFLSHRALGIPLRYRTRRALRMWEGVSVYRTAEQAADRATAMPYLGRYVAELRVPEGGEITWELDNGEGGHSTLWGEPARLLAAVVSMARVEGVH